MEYNGEFLTASQSRFAILVDLGRILSNDSRECPRGGGALVVVGNAGTKNRCFGWALRLWPGFEVASVDFEDAETWDMRQLGGIDGSESKWATTLSCNAWSLRAAESGGVVPVESFAHRAGADEACSGSGSF